MSEKQIIIPLSVLQDYNILGVEEVILDTFRLVISLLVLVMETKKLLSI